MLCAEHCPWVDLPGQLWDVAQERALGGEFDESPLCCIPEMFLQHLCCACSGLAPVEVSGVPVWCCGVLGLPCRAH